MNFLSRRLIISREGCHRLGARRSLHHAPPPLSEEVHKFSQLAAEWWNPMQNPLLAMNPVRMQFIRECLESYESVVEEEEENESSSAAAPTNTVRHILDVGCGGGLLAESWVRRDRRHFVTGVDPSVALITMAQQHAQQTLGAEEQSRLQYLCGTLEEAILAASEESTTTYDIMSCCDVLEHVPDPASLIHSMSQRLRPGGLLFVSTIDRTLVSYLVTIVGAEYMAGLLPRGTHAFHKYMSPPEVALLATRAGLVPRRIAGMVVPVRALPAAVLLRQWSWQLDATDTRVNWIGCYQKAH